MVRPGSTTMVPPPLIRRPTVKPSCRAASRSTSLARDWCEPRTRAARDHSQKRSVGPRLPAISRSSSTSSSASCTWGSSGTGMMTSHSTRAAVTRREVASLSAGAGLREHPGGMAVGPHAVPGSLDHAVGADKEGRAYGPGRAAAVEHLFPVGPVPAGHLVIGVSEQREAEAVPGPEAPVAVAVVAGDADDVDVQVPEPAQLVVELAGLLRAA